MTAVCTLCGVVIEAKPDGVMDDQRDDRTLGRLGGMFRAHIQKHHANEPQTILDESIVRGNLGALISAVAIASQGLTLFSFLQTDDAVFQLKMAQMRDIVAKGITQKPMMRPGPVATIAG